LYDFKEEYMKKVIFSLCLLLVFIMSVHAQFSSSRISTTAKSFQTMWDNDLVLLEGYIVKQINEKAFIFKDDTGKIEVRVSHTDFNPIKTTSKTKVKVWGKVDVLWPSKTKIVLVDFVEPVIGTKEYPCDPKS